MPLFTCLIILLLLSTPNAEANDILTPLQARELTPFAQIYPRSLVTNRDDDWRISIDYELANTQIYETKGDESVALDLEYEYRGVVFERGFADTWALAITLGRGAYSEGSTDGFIEDWHDTFGLPNGSRDKYPQDLIALQYVRGAQQAMDIRTSQSSMTDTQIQLSKSLSESQSINLWATAPTGDEQQWLGADGVNVGVAWSYTSAFSDRGSWFASLGGMRLANAPTPLVQNKDYAASFAFGGAWALNELVALKLQAHGHTAYYDSNLGPLGDDALVLVMGGTLRLSEEWLLDVSVTEDLAVDASPDVGLHLALKWHSL